MTGLIDALVALGLGTLQADGRLAFEVDPVERLLLDARSVLPRLSRRGPGGRRHGCRRGDRWVVGGGVATVPLGDRISCLRPPRTARRDGLRGRDDPGRGSEPRRHGDRDERRAGRVSAAVGIGDGTGPNGRFGLTVAVDTAAAAPVAASLTRTGGADGLPGPSPCCPSLTSRRSAGWVLRRCRPRWPAWRSSWPCVSCPALAPLCDAVGLRDAVAGRVRVPAGLMADPAGWLLSTATLGAAGGRPDPVRVAAVVGALRSLVPGPHPADGLALPWGLVLRTADVSGTLRVTVGLPTPMQLGSLRVNGSAGLELQPSGAVAPAFAVVLDLTDPGAPASVLGGIDVGLGATVSAAARVPIAGTTLTVPVLPLGGGLAGLAGAGHTGAADRPRRPHRGRHVRRAGRRRRGRRARRRAGPAASPAASTSLELELLLSAGLSQRPPGSCQPHRSRRCVAGVARPPGARHRRGHRRRRRAGPRRPPRRRRRPHRQRAERCASRPRRFDRSTSWRSVGELCLGAGGVRALRIGVEVADPDLLRVGGVALLPGSDVHDRGGHGGAGRRGRGGAVDGRQQQSTVRPSWCGSTWRPVSAVRWRTGGATPVDLDDAVAAAFGLARAYLVPLAAGLALGVAEVRDVLERNLLATGRHVGQLLHPHVLERTSSGGQVRYRLALFDAEPDGSFDLGDLMRRTAGRRRGGDGRAGQGGGALPLGDLPLSAASPACRRWRRPVRCGPGHPGRTGSSCSSTRGCPALARGRRRLAGRSRRSLRRRSAAAAWSCTSCGSRQPATRRLAPGVLVRGLGLRIDTTGRPEADRPRGHAALASACTATWTRTSARADVRVGGHLELDQFGIPLGGAGGNPVAANFMAPSSDAGDAEHAGPGVQPERGDRLQAGRLAGIDVIVRAGPGDGPWWLPIQRAFGPLYVEQVGLGIERTSAATRRSVSILVDGGASRGRADGAGRRPRGDHPVGDAVRPGPWRLDLAGIAVGYEGGGITVAGGLRKLDRNGQRRLPRHAPASRSARTA